MNYFFRNAMVIKDTTVMGMKPNKRMNMIVGDIIHAILFKLGNVSQFVFSTIILFGEVFSCRFIISQYLCLSWCIVLFNPIITIVERKIVKIIQTIKNFFISIILSSLEYSTNLSIIQEVFYA